MPAQETRTVNYDRNDPKGNGKVIGERLDFGKSFRATGLQWGGLLRYEELGYLTTITVEKAVRYYSWEQLAFTKRMHSFLDGKTC
jgi:hypothetical protein